MRSRYSIREQSATVPGKIFLAEECLGVQEVEEEVQFLAGTQFPFPGGRQQVGLNGVQYRKAARQMLNN